MKTIARRLALLHAVLAYQGKKLANAQAHRWHRQVERIRRRIGHTRALIRELESR